MTSTRSQDIRVVPTPVNVVDRHSSSHPADQTSITLSQYHASFAELIGPNPTHCLVLSSAESSRNPLFQAACVYLPSHDELFTTSKPLKASSSQAPLILMSRLKIIYDTDSGDITAVEWQKLRPPPVMPMPASGTLVPSKSLSDGNPGNETILFCSQGSMTPESGGIYLMPRGEPPIPCVTSYHGRRFNSPYAATVHSDWSVWFTDPTIGQEADFRPDPVLPPQVYRYDPGTGETRAMADGFQKPVGIAIDSERETVYVSDAGQGEFSPAGHTEGSALSFLQSLNGAGNKEDAQNGSATIYAFDLIHKNGSPFLTSRRLFAFARQGVPTQLMCDKSGNIWAACGDGIEIWSCNGALLGVIEVPGGVTSFCRGKRDDLFICGGMRLWNIQLSG